MAEIKCPMCGKPNPAELDVCQFCEARLKPLTDELARSQPPLHAGEEPTPIDTAELESGLPRWLRDVRQQARDSAGEEPEQAQAEEESPQPGKSGDLLAGLQSQAESDEEIPDWLSDLRGEGAQIAPEETSAEEGDLAAMESMPGEDSEAGALPGWFSDLGAGESGPESGGGEISSFLTEGVTEEPAQIEPEPTASSTDFEWNADFGSESDSQADSAEDEAPIESELPAWLQGADEGTKSEGGLPDWMGAEETSQEAPALESDDSAQSAAGSDLPDWLSSLDKEESAEAAPQEEGQSAVEGDMPGWLSSLGEEEGLAAAPSEGTVQSAAEGDTPDWLASLGRESTDTPLQQEVAQSATEDESPDWVSSLGERFEEAPLQGEEQPTAEGDLPDWLSSMGEETTRLDEASAELEVPPFMTEGTAQEASVPAAFTDEEGEPSSTDDVDALFSAEMPDWLSSPGEPTQEKAAAESVEAQAEGLSPADLPSWVQAMRPVESVISETGEGTTADQYMEETGPLAGLRGVLPAVSGVGPSSIPKAYSIKLQASEEQQSGATMLEQMLAAEVNPKPIATQPIVLSQRLLRWMIALVLLAVVGGSIFTGTQMNPTPLGVSPETKVFLEDFVQGSMPADAPVLVIFDYDAALASELESAAAPLIDYMILQRAPRLSLISSTPTGPGLAEQFMSLENTQASIYYQAGLQFINLGYLPGGAAGVLAFAENPASAKPVSIDGGNAWGTPVLQGVSRLSDFAVMILLTNDVETARIWIEQTEAARGDTRFVVISSAQSGPLILPYLQSGQVDVMLTGLDGGVPIEQFNGGRPGLARRYWDAYGFGLLVALAMIAFGSLWSLVSGLRERRREQGEA